MGKHQPQKHSPTYPEHVTQPPTLDRPEPAPGAGLEPVSREDVTLANGAQYLTVCKYLQQRGWKWRKSDLSGKWRWMKQYRGYYLLAKTWHDALDLEDAECQRGEE